MMSRQDEAWRRYNLMCPLENHEPVERAFREAWERQERLIATVHERVACPKCDAPVGERCRNLSKRPDLWRVPQLVKHPHRERLRAAGISMR